MRHFGNFFSIFKILLLLYFHKSVINEKCAQSAVFTLRPFYRLRKSVWVDFLNQIYDFLYLENYPHKSEISGSMDRSSCEKLHCISGYAHFVLDKSFNPQKVNFSAFFEILLFSKKFPPNLRF